VNRCGPGCGGCGRCESGGRPDEVCADCSTGVWLGRFDVAPFLCDECYAARERWAAEQEAKSLARKMVKADLTQIMPRIIPKKDVA
jgi:hypothetical protein